jgi:hypothetical protein
MPVHKNNILVHRNSRGSEIQKIAYKTKQASTVFSVRGNTKGDLLIERLDLYQKNRRAR